MHDFWNPLSQLFVNMYICLVLSIPTPCVVGIFVRIILKNAGPPMQNLDPFREVAELILRVYLSMDAESVTGVSNSRDLAWSELKNKHFG